MDYSFIQILLILCNPSQALNQNVLKTGILLFNDSTDALYNISVIDMALGLGIEHAKQTYNVKVDVTKKSYAVDENRRPSQIYREECNVQESIRHMSDFLLANKKQDAYIGPTCSEDLQHVATLAEQYKKPVISAGAFGIPRRTHDAYLSRVAFQIEQYASFIVDLAKSWKIHNLLIITEGRRGYILVRDRLKKALSENRYVLNTDDIIDYRRRLVSKGFGKANQHTTRYPIIVFIGSMQEFHFIMEKAHDANTITGDVMFIYPTILERQDIRDWRTGTDRDYLLRRAFRVVTYITLESLATESKNEFLETLKTFAAGKGLHLTNASVNLHSVGYYDAVMYLAAAYNFSLMHTNKCPDNFAKCKWDAITPSQASGNIVMDSMGNRRRALALTMDVSTSGYKMLKLFMYSTQNRLKEIDPLRRHWLGGRFPLLPTHDFVGGENILMAIVLFALVASPVFIYATVQLVQRILKTDRKLRNSWIIDWNDIIEVAMMNRNDDSSENSDSMKPVDVLNTKTILARYDGNLVALRTSTMEDLNLTRQLLHEIKIRQMSNHPNCNGFIGICTTPGHISCLTEYCHKGSLHELLTKSSIRLDWRIRSSLLKDLITGLAYLHSSLIGVHGRLTSINCLIDRRFILKLSDFGLNFFYDDGFVQSRVRWMSPERLDGGPPSKECDMYSFGIILCEIVMRQDPYADENISMDEICERIVAQTVPPFRPTLDEARCPAEMGELIRKCWDDSPSARPSAQVVKLKVRVITKGHSTDKIVEQYAANLESVIAERTKTFIEEKRKSEDLLYRILPRPIAAKLALGESVEPELFESATVLFCDIVDFVVIASRCKAPQLIALINRLSSIIDSIIDAYDATKLDMIGDATMAISGAPIRNGISHAREVASLAIDVLHSVSRALMRPDEKKKRVGLRIGISSGPLCAGIVGHSLPKYTVFGDTVNTASRMESTCLPRRIQISDPAQEILKGFDMFKIEYRGEVYIKGKGDVPTHWLVGRKEKLLGD